MKNNLLLFSVLIIALGASCDNSRKTLSSGKAEPSITKKAGAPKVATAGIFSGFDNSNTSSVGGVNLVIKSADGGQTWDDISMGLDPAVQFSDFIAQAGGFYLRSDNGVFHSKLYLGNTYWEKEKFGVDHVSMAPARKGMYAFTSAGKFFYRATGTNVWTPVYPNVNIKEVRTIFEHENGVVFIGSENGLFKSANAGKTWKQVHRGGWVMKVVASGNVLLATSDVGILRSADNGETWMPVISEGGVGIAVEVIHDGFAAITYNDAQKIRRVRTSYDGGKTWQPIDLGMPASPLISSVVQAGNSFFCGHPDGIYKSMDNGKTWTLIFPSIDDKVFNLTVFGNTVFALRKNGGC
ncbi:MAG: exo-alpha-sialidase [Bacteroidetes bacterium]|nr:exo-alpha-sialidase [Bacteroidota bacterium]